MTTPRRRRTPRRPGLDDNRYRTNREHLKRIGSHVCHWCRHVIDMQLPYPHPLSWSCDHKVPRSQLTADDPRHWQLEWLTEAHLRCNQSRGAKPIRPIPGINAGLNTSIDW